MEKKKYYWITSIIILLSCGNSLIKSKKNNINIEKQDVQLIKFFGDSLMDHFPKDSAFFYGEQNIDTFGYHNTFSFFLTNINAKKQIDFILNEKAGNLLSSTDSCLLIVNNFLTSLNVGDPFRDRLTDIPTGCMNNFIPIPNFAEHYLETDETRSRLPKDFKFNIIDYKTGVYSKKLNIEKSSMPSSILHGYSKGIAFSEKQSIIIYWILIW